MLAEYNGTYWRITHKKRTWIQDELRIIDTFPMKPGFGYQSRFCDCESICHRKVAIVEKSNRQHRPSMKCGMKQSSSAPTILHSLATLIAVKMLSPVHITLRIPAVFNSEITWEVLGFSLFSNMMKPKNSRLLSASARASFWTFIQLSLRSYFVAHAITRYPL